MFKSDELMGDWYDVEFNLHILTGKNPGFKQLKKNIQALHQPPRGASPPCFEPPRTATRTGRHHFFAFAAPCHHEALGSLRPLP